MNNLSLPRDEWKKKTEYHIRSLVETHMWRHKSAFSHTLSFRNFKGQETEVMIKTNILNRFLEI
jgi:hypothetical protein